MAIKSKHKHDYHKHIVRDGESVLGVRYDVVNVCSICNKIKALPLRERLVRTESGYLWPTHIEQIREFYGDLPLFERK